MTSDPGRVLAIDLGDSRHGLALSDPLGITAQPLESIDSIGPRKDLRCIEQLVRERDVRTVVVGLPRLLSGAEGSRAAASREFAESLSRRLAGVDVELWDERLTTVEAERTMISGGVRRSVRKRRVDAVAAALILQSFLDARGSISEET